MDELSVLTNMTVEGGLMTGIVIPGESVKAFLASARPGLSFDLVLPDPGALYARTVEIDLDEVPLTIATPGDARNRAPLSEHVGTEIHNVVIASCTGGSLEDLRAATEVIRGRSLAAGTRLTVTPSSAEVARRAESEGLIEVLRGVGAEITDPGCGSCIGNGPWGSAPRRDNRFYDQPQLRPAHGRPWAGVPGQPRRGGGSGRKWPIGRPAASPLRRDRSASSGGILPRAKRP